MFLVLASFVCLATWLAAGQTLAVNLSDLSEEELPQSIRDLPTFGSVQWETNHLPFVGSEPDEGISGMGMVVHDEDIYLMGGFTPETYPYRTSNWLHRYDTQTATWTRLDDMPGRREYCRAVTVDDHIYLIGGAEQGKYNSPYNPRGDAFRYDVAAGSWDTSWTSLSVPRSHTSVGRLGNYLVVAGGNQNAGWSWNQSTIRDTTEVLDLNNTAAGWQTVTPIPGDKRGWSATAVVQDKLYMLGGSTFDSSGAVRLQEALRYTVADDTWTELTAPPVAISGWEGEVYQDRYILATGGVIAMEGQSDIVWNDMVFVYDTQDDLWMKIDGFLPPGGLHNDVGICIIGDTIYAAGAEGPRVPPVTIGGAHYDYFLIGQISQVPEPSSLMLVICAAAGFFVLRAFRKHSPRAS